MFLPALILLLLPRPIPTDCGESLQAQMGRIPRAAFTPGQTVAVPNIWRQQNDRRRWLPAVVVEIFEDFPDADNPWAVVRSFDRSWDLAISLCDLKPWRPWFGHKRPTGLPETH